MKKSHSSIQKSKANRGYTLLFAVITASLVLGVALFIVDVSRKQFELSVSARNSIYSFYAADSGIECVINGPNWINTGGFASTTGGTLSCGNATAVFSTVNSPSISPAGTLTGDSVNPIRQQKGSVLLSVTGSGLTTNQCAEITITTGTNPSTSQPETIIDSRGYNSCTPSAVPDTTNPATVERALRLRQAGVW